MNAEILSIGTELVLGDIVNTNAQYLSKQLALKGINVFYQSNIGDNPERIIRALSIAMARSNLIIFTGGLGPTADDITVSTVAKALDIPLEKNEEAYEHIKRYFERIGKPMTENNEKQAWLPKGCIVLPNKQGTAPGCVIEKDNKCVVFLPGPPRELEAMFENSLSAYLDKYADGIILSKFVNIYGVGESMIDEKAKDLINGTNPTVAPYAKNGEAQLRITAKSDSTSHAQLLIDQTILKIKKLFGDNIYGYNDDTLESVVVAILKNKKMTVATAESCTAGYISKRITDISGASLVFNMGVSTYSNESKTKQLGVPSELIEQYGAVSEQVAASMAKGVRIKSGSDIGLSITGIAGPKSDDSGKPVGLAYIGISDKNGEYVIKSQKGGKNDREYIRYASASEALNFLRLHLLDAEPDCIKTNAVLLLENNTEVIEDTSIQDLKSEEERQTQIKQRSLFIHKPVVLNPEELDNTLGENDNQSEEEIQSEAVSLDSLGRSNYSNIDKINVMIDQTSYVPVEDEEAEQVDEIVNEIFEENLKEDRKQAIKNLFIHKDDTKEEKGRKATFWSAAIALFLAVVYMVFYLVNPIIQQKKIDKLSELIHADNTRGYYSSIMNPKFEELYKKNKDIVGWVTVKGTNIDYPVVQREDNEYYMRRGFDKSYSREGSIFADSKSSIEYKKETKNIVLYGHHMDSTDTMFRQLDKFQDINFYKNPPTVIFDSLYRDGDYIVFAAFITNSIPEQDNGNYYDYRQTEFESDEEFISWIADAKTRSLIITGVDVNENDEILTLQTCNNSFESEGEKARLIVMARRVRDGETASTTISEAMLNPTPKYPQMWYDVNGQVNPFIEQPQTTTVPTTSVATKATKTTATTTKPSSTSSSQTNVQTASVNATAASTTKLTTKVTTKKTTTKKPTSSKPKTTVAHVGTTTASPTNAEETVTTSNNE